MHKIEEAEEMDQKYAEHLNEKQQEELRQQQKKEQEQLERDELVFKIMNDFPHLEFQMAQQMLQDSGWKYQDVYNQLT